MEKVGVVYVLTNPSFPEYVKIGYADDVEKRVAQLNGYESVPFSFRIYATYAVSKRLADKTLHRIIDGINSKYRVRETINGKTRVREFYEMPANDVYSLLYDIAEFSDSLDRLKKYEPSENDIAEVKQAETAKKHYERKRKALTFSEYGIPVGSELVYVKNPEIKCTVVSDKKVEFEGKIYSISALAGELNVRAGSTNRAVAGTDVFSYNGEILSMQLRKRLGI